MQLTPLIRHCAWSGRFDPRHSETGYIFQYGTTPALGGFTDSVDIGDGSVPQLVSQVLHGLSPNTTYYFRLAATNLSGTTVSTGQTVATRMTPLPNPDDRAYEQVSPPDKNFTDVDSGALPKATAAPDGQAAGICTATSFGDPPQPYGGFCADFVFSRTDTGWQTKRANVPYCFADTNSTSGQSGPAAATAFLSRDMTHAVVGQPETAACSPPLDPAAPLPGTNLYRADFGMDPTAYTLLRACPSIRRSGLSRWCHLCWGKRRFQSHPLHHHRPRDARCSDWQLQQGL